MLVCVFIHLCCIATYGIYNFSAQCAPFPQHFKEESATPKDYATCRVAHNKTFNSKLIFKFLFHPVTGMLPVHAKYLAKAKGKITTAAVFMGLKTQGVSESCQQNADFTGPLNRRSSHREHGFVQSAELTGRAVSCDSIK